MPNFNFSLYQKTLALIDATTWGEGAQQTFVEEIWPKLEHDYEGMVAELVTICKKIIRDQGITGMVEGRVKTGDSIERSLHRRRLYRLENKQPACSSFRELLSEIHDLAGIRIVVDLPDHLEPTSKLISAIQIFRSAKPPNEFKADRNIGTLWQPWFGAYECVNHHVTAQFPNSDPLQCYNNVLFEIQVTSLAASLYNKIAHPLHYKNQAGELSRGDEIVIDLTRGLGLCYSLCLYYKHDRLATNEIDFMRQQASIDQGDISDPFMIDPWKVLPDVPELRNTKVKNIPARILQQALANFSPMPGGVTSTQVWDSVVRNLRPAIQLVDIRNKAISKLPFDQMDSREISIKSAEEDTCHWILDIPEYQSWQGTESTYDAPPIFWIKGKAGTGKSTAMKFLLKKKRESAGCDTVLSFFFNARGSLEEKSTMGLYRALLYQLFKSEVDLCSNLDKLGHVYLESIVKFGWKDESALKEILRGALLGRQSKSRIYFFIDALDECPEKQVRDMLDLFQSCSTTKKLDTVRLCFASRPYPEIGIRNCQEFFLDQAPGHREDINAYVDLHLMRFNLTKTDLNLLKEEILLKSAGIFMWVILVIRILEEGIDAGICYSMKSLKQKLAEIPPGLHALFQDIITKDGEISGALHHTLQWLLYARRPLSPAVFCDAIWISEGKIDKENEMTDNQEGHRKVILHASKGLAEITGAKTPTVQFIHESVKDFLLTNGKFVELELGDNFEGRSHDALAKACSLRIGSHSGSPMKPDEPPLFSYARKSMFHHANNAQRCGVSQEAFISNFPLQSWRTNFPYSANKDKSTTLLYLLAEHGAEHLIPLCPGRESHLKSTMKGGQLDYPAFAAIWAGKYNSLSALFGFSPSENRQLVAIRKRLRSVLRKRNREQFSTCCGIPLFLEYGDYQLLHQILESDQYDIPCSNHRLDTGRFLNNALTEERLDLWFKFSKRLNLFRSCSFNKDNDSTGSRDIISKVGISIKELSRHNFVLYDNILRQSIPSTTTLADSDHIEEESGLWGYLRTPFRLLYRNPWGHSELWKPIRRCANQTLETGSMEYLQEAIERCPQLLHLEIWGEDLCLHYALRKGFYRLVVIAVSQIIRTRDDLGATAAAIASVAASSADLQMRSTIIDLLLEASFTLDGPVLLHHSIRAYENLAMVKFLLHEFARIDVNWKDDQGRTALHIALNQHFYIKNDNFEVIRELLEAGADPNHLYDNGTTILHHAAKTTDETLSLAFINFVLDKVPNIEIEARDKENHTALFLLVERGFCESVSLLLKAGAPPEDGLLRYCLDRGKPDVFNALLSTHLPVWTGDVDVYGLFQQMAQLGKGRYVDSLLRLGRAAIPSTMLREIILDGKEGVEGEIQSGEALRILLNAIRIGEGERPSREMLPFKEAIEKGRDDMVQMMDAFLRDGSLLRPYDKLAHLKFHWTGRY